MPETVTVNGVTQTVYNETAAKYVYEDGTVTIMDYASAKSCVVGKTEFNGNAEIIGDIIFDCIIDAFDLFQIDKTVNDIN